MSKYNKNEKIVLSAPPLVYLLLIFLVPALLMVIVAFREPGNYGGVAPLIENINNHRHFNLSLNSFISGIKDIQIWKIFCRSLYFSIITTILCLIIGYPLALFIARSFGKLRNILLLLVIIPFWSCFLIRVYAWMLILGPNSFIYNNVNYIRKLFGLAPLELLYSSIAVIACLVYISLPFMVLPLYANLEKHDMSLIEASRDLGATSAETFWKITVPLSLPGILAGSGLVFIPCIGMFVVPELVGNNNSFMIGNLIKQQFLQAMNWPLGSFTSILMTILVLFISVIIGIIFSKFGGLKYAKK
jgi:spermidine/putrescine transport system permease protein